MLLRANMRKEGLMYARTVPLDTARKDVCDPSHFVLCSTDVFLTLRMLL